MDVVLGCISLVVLSAFMSGKRCRLLGHKYEARYDEVPLGNAHFAELSVRDPEAFRTMLVREVYVRDMCVRCGTSVEREKENERKKNESRQ